MNRQKNEGSLKRNWISAFSLCLVLLIFTAVGVSFSKDAVRLYFFYSNESGGQKVEEEFIKPLSKKYQIEIQSFSLNELNNYDLLDKFEKELKQEGNELPAVIIGNKILGGEAKIRRDLEALVKSYAEQGGVPWPALHAAKAEQWITQAPTEEDRKSQKIIYGAFLYRLGCKHCEARKAELKEWASRFPDLRIGAFDLTEDENKKVEEAFFQVYRIPESKQGEAVKLYIGEDYILDSDLSYEHLQKVVSKYQGKGAPPPWEKVSREGLKTGEQRIIDRFKKFSLSGVLIAGFIDGINPCAFATIIFLVSYLTFIGKKSREILFYGIIFTLGVFTAYLLAGMGLMAGLRQLSGFPLITRAIYLIIAVFAFVLGIISLYDYVLFRRGKMSEWKLQLPASFKKRMHKIIREGTQSQRAGYLGTFALGFVIAATEVICTGQVYLPTIQYIMTIPKLRVHAFLNLVLYNIMFIIPLVAIFVAVYSGVTSERLALIAKRYTGLVKLSTAILFFALAGILFFIR